jgi:hypothetical protein
MNHQLDPLQGRRQLGRPGKIPAPDLDPLRDPGEIAQVTGRMLEDPDPVAGREQGLYDMGADETGSSENETEHDNRFR